MAEAPAGRVTFVIDASAVLAILQGETGAAAALDGARGALFSAVNLSETLAKMNDRGIDPARAIELMDDLHFDIVPFDREQAIAAASLRPATRYKDVSLADRICLGLASVRNMPILTGDRKWMTLDLGLDIRLIR